VRVASVAAPLVACARKLEPTLKKEGCDEHFDHALVETKSSEFIEDDLSLWHQRMQASIMSNVIRKNETSDENQIVPNQNGQYQPSTKIELVTMFPALISGSDLWGSNGSVSFASTNSEAEDQDDSPLVGSKGAHSSRNEMQESLLESVLSGRKSPLLMESKGKHEIDGSPPANGEGARVSWLVMDGPTPSSWMEILCMLLPSTDAPVSVAQENFGPEQVDEIEGGIVLHSAGPARLPALARVIFEQDSMEHACPALITRCSLVHIQSNQCVVTLKTECRDDSGSKPVLNAYHAALVKAWLQHLPLELSDRCRRTIARSVWSLLPGCVSSLAAFPLSKSASGSADRTTHQGSKKIAQNDSCERWNSALVALRNFLQLLWSLLRQVVSESAPWRSAVARAALEQKRQAKSTSRKRAGKGIPSPATTTANHHFEVSGEQVSALSCFAAVRHSCW
jgi:hypothetical protein